MSDVFFPGCRIKAGYGSSSEKLRVYMEKRHGLTATGCCKEYGPRLRSEDTAVLICNNCAQDLKDMEALGNVSYVIDRIDGDESFHFPDHGGTDYVLQDCGHGYGAYDAGRTVRSLLTKMKVSFRELPAEAKVPDGLTFPEHAAVVKKNIETMAEENVITYCPICNLVYQQNGKKPRLLLDLLFSE